MKEFVRRTQVSREQLLWQYLVGASIIVLIIFYSISWMNFFYVGMCLWVISLGIYKSIKEYRNFLIKVVVTSAGISFFKRNSTIQNLADEVSIMYVKEYIFFNSKKGRLVINTTDWMNGEKMKTELSGFKTETYVNEKQPSLWSSLLIFLWEVQDGRAYPSIFLFFLIRNSSII